MQDRHAVSYALQQSCSLTIDEANNGPSKLLRYPIVSVLVGDREPASYRPQIKRIGLQSIRRGHMFVPYSRNVYPALQTWFSNFLKLGLGLKPTMYLLGYKIMEVSNIFDVLLILPTQSIVSNGGWKWLFYRLQIASVTSTPLFVAGHRTPGVLANLLCSTCCHFGNCHFSIPVFHWRWWQVWLSLCIVYVNRMRHNLGQNDSCFDKVRQSSIFSTKCTLELLVTSVWNQRYNQL